MDNFIPKVCVVGLGYVGLPLLVELKELPEVYGYDVDPGRISELKKGYDRTGEITRDTLTSANIAYTNDISVCSDCNIYIVTVPTPVTHNNEPDPKFLVSACNEIGPMLEQGDLVIFESTVYPGLTREICFPILEHHSRLSVGRQIYVGYSPERINPGDKTKRLKDITKVTSGCCETSRNLVEKFYRDIVGLTTHSAPSIEIAEAAKVIENTQRDINIALMNELSEIFLRCNIDTNEVIKAASTKWNFHSYKPGLVGGHCIGIDPYYIAHKARQVGVEPKVILSGRATNERVVNRIIKEVTDYSSNAQGVGQHSILILGATFKENCPDVRNSKSVELYHSLKSLHYDVVMCDPIADFQGSINPEDQRNITSLGDYDTIIITVSHALFEQLGIEEFKKHLKKDGKIFDIKGMFPREYSHFTL